MTDWDQSIDDLSPKQRQVLARWLALHSITRNTSLRRRRLVAYVIGDTDSETLRQYLGKRLPDFMVPNSINVLDEIPRLSNGKVDFASLSEPTQRDESTDTIVLPRNAVEKTLSEIWQELLYTDLISVHDNFFEIGGDSIISIQVVSRAREAGLSIRPQDIAKYPTIAELAVVASDSVENVTKDEVTLGNAPTTPIQSWFLSRNLAAPHHWNQTRLLEVPASVSEESLQQAIRYCVVHHDALRSTFSQHNGSWIQSISSDQNEVRLERLTFPTPDTNVVDSVVAQFHREFDLQKGPLVRFVLLEFDDHSARRLVIISHHLVIDHVSWSILLNDLTRHSQSDMDGESQEIRKSASMMTWMQHLKQYAASDQCQATLRYWTDISDDTCFDLPVDHKLPVQPDEATAETIRTSLAMPMTQQLLTKANDAYNTRADDIIMTAMAQTLLHWVDAPFLRIDLERHGREPIAPELDLSNTIGWFTSFFPITLGLSDSSDPGSAIKQVKEQLRGIPHQGIDYGVLRYLSDNEKIRSAIQDIQPAKVLINYLGTTNTTRANHEWKVLDHNSRADRSTRNLRSHWLEINSGIWDGRLSVLWTFSNAIHRRETIEQLDQEFQSRIGSLIEHCLNPDSGGMTPTDFPESGLSQDELDELLDELE